MSYSRINNSQDPARISFASSLAVTDGDLGAPDAPQISDDEHAAQVGTIDAKISDLENQILVLSSSSRKLMAARYGEHLVCRASCQCRQDIAAGLRIAPELSSEELVVWLKAFREYDPDITPGVVLRGHLYGAATEPDNELNRRRVELALRFCAFGLTPKFYLELKRTVFAIPPLLLIEVLGGQEPAKALGLQVSEGGTRAEKTLQWRPFCPLTWNQSSFATQAVFGVIGSLKRVS